MTISKETSEIGAIETMSYVRGSALIVPDQWVDQGANHDLVLSVILGAQRCGTDGLHYAGIAAQTYAPKLDFIAQPGCLEALVQALDQASIDLQEKVMAVRVMLYGTITGESGPLCPACDATPTDHRQQEDHVHMADSMPSHEFKLCDSAAPQDPHCLCGLPASDHAPADV